jgi:hypothetical protein
MPKSNWKGDEKNKSMSLRKIAAFLFIQYSLLAADAQVTSFPTPTGNPKQLFFLQRTPNANTIVCELNNPDGVLDTDNPVHVFWIRYQEKGQREELNFIQRKFAYGIKSKKIAENQYELSFVSYKKQKMYLMPGADKQYHVYATINGKQAILSRFYLHINGGSFWKPNVEYIELSGTDPVSRQAVKERKKIENK